MSLEFIYQPRIGSFIIENLVSFSEDLGRRVEDFIPASGDGNEALDKGQIPTKYNLTFELVGTAEQISQQYLEFAALQEVAKNRVFVHPLLGPKVVKLGSHQASNDPSSHSFTTTLIQVKPFTETAVTVEQVTQEEVDISILAAASILEDSIPEDSFPDLGEFDDVFVGEPPDLGEFPPVDLREIQSRTQSWDSETSPQIMNRDLEGMLSDIRRTEDVLSSQNSDGDWEALKRLNDLAGTIIQRAETLATQDLLQWESLRVTGRGSLRNLITRTYGRLADEVYDQILVRNDIQDPWNIKDGTEIQIVTLASLGV